MEFARLNQDQLNKIKQAESSLNSMSKDTSDEFILLAYTKPENPDTK
ncbi:hypothetical protein [Desulfosporosinus acidiphilus]|nr:hypothetical protein [Desulfosporosinus acidiphilus]